MGHAPPDGNPDGSGGQRMELSGRLTCRLDPGMRNALSKAMARYVPISRERHQGKSYLRLPNFAFAAQEALVPVAARELPQAALALPLGFAEFEGRLRLVALLSTLPGQNLFVGPDGKWLGTYVPAWLRFYPFRLVGTGTANERLLCVDEDSGAIVDGSAKGEPIFEPNGDLGPTVKQALGVLNELESSRKITDAAVDSLLQSKTLREWPITLRTEQGEKKVSGVSCVDEAALSALPDDTFLSLRHTAALPVGYAQLLSMGNLNIFSRILTARSKAVPQSPPKLPESLDGLFGLTQDDTVRFR